MEGCRQIHTHSHSCIQTISRPRVPKKQLPNTSLATSIPLSPSASTSMQKTLMSLWGFATAHFHGKSSVLCLRQHCQVLIIHRDESQSKAEPQMSLCHRNPLDERKHVFVLEEEKDRCLPSPRPFWWSSLEQVCETVTLWLKRMRGNRFIDGRKLIVVFNYLLSTYLYVFHMLRRARESHVKSWVNVTCAIYQLPFTCWFLRAKPPSFSTPSYSPEVTRILVELAQNQWSLEFTVQKEAELIFTVIKQGGKPVPEACHLPPTHEKLPRTLIYEHAHTHYAGSEPRQAG